MTWDLAMIPYANMAPCRVLDPPAGCRWRTCVPSASVEALRRGEVWAAAVPLGGLPALAGLVEEVGAAGIATGESCGSVLLFSRRPLAALDASCRIRVTGESATSVRLLGLLLGRDPTGLAAVGDGEAEAELLIGDAALLRAARPHGWPVVVDLAGAWWRRTGTPMVFARWVLRHDAPAPLRRAFASWLEELARRQDDLRDRAAGIEAQRLGLAAAALRAYLAGIRLIFGPEELAGQARFLAALAGAPLAQAS